MELFFSYHRKEALSYMQGLSKFLLGEFNDVVIKSEKIDYRLQGYDDAGIRTKIRDEHMRNCDVVVVFLSKNAWKRKHLDWELSAALSKSKFSSRAAVVVVLLPEYGSKIIRENNRTSMRIIQNIDRGYIEVIRWNEIDASTIKNVVSKAIKNKNTILPNNSYPLRRKNKA